MLGRFRRRRQPPPAAEDRLREPIAAYRLLAAPAIRRALRSRDVWLIELDAICADLHRKGVRPALHRAATVGTTYSARFAHHRLEFYSMRPPRGSEGYHELWLAWLHRLEQANALLTNAATQRNMAILDAAADALAEARPMLAALNGDRAWLAHFLDGERGATSAQPA